MIPWHRLFGIALTDLLAGTAWEVVLELDLSIKQQLLDIVIVRRAKGKQPRELPDGLGPLADHNLVTYKSLREPLDDWALKELAAHSVNYRKQVSPSFDRLLPESSFRLFAVCTRFPKKLENQVTWQPLSPGVYDVPWGTDKIRVLVLSEMPVDDRNTFWNLFSADRERVNDAADRYRRRHRESSTILNQLFENYSREGVAMPYTMQDFLRDVTKEHLDLLTPGELIENLTAEKLCEVKRVVDERLTQSNADKKSQPRPQGKSKRERKHEKH